MRHNERPVGKQSAKNPFYGTFKPHSNDFSAQKSERFFFRIIITSPSKCRPEKKHLETSFSNRRFHFIENNEYLCINQAASQQFKTSFIALDLH